MSRQCRASRATCREAGFSLLETLVSTMLMAVIAVIAMQLWDHSFQLIGSSGRALTDASMMPLAAALRSDLVAASAVETPSASWTGSGLTLLTQEGGSIHYQLHAGAVTRTAIGPASESRPAVTSRRFGSKVRLWQWRMPDPGLIEIRVGHAVHEEPWLAAQRHGPQQQARVMPEVRTLKLALRGHQGGSSW